MIKYQDEITSREGNVVPGAIVTVYLAGTSTLATLYANSAGSASLANPVTANYTGYFYFYAASGTYDLVITGTGISQIIYTDVTLGGSGIAGQFVVDGTTYTTIQAAITAAGATGSVTIPSNYAGTDTYTNPNKIQIIDLRPSANRQRGYINVLTDCGLKGDGVTDDSAALTACMASYGASRYFFPPTNFNNDPSYFFASSITPPVGSPGSVFTGGSNSFINSTTKLAGTVLKFPAGVTGFNLQNCGCTIEYLSLLGSESTQQLQNPSLLNIPSDTNLPLFTRSISAIQRASNVLTVTVTRVVAIEGLTQQVGSTVKISGVVGDATMNGLCVVTALSGNTAFGGNPNTFTCAQNGADSGPFGAVGTVSLPTTGASAADGIRVCNNHSYINHVTIQSFGRHGINADSFSGHGCTVAFSDDLIVRDSFLNGNQANGYLCYGVDCNAHLLSGNEVYYNVMWGIEDQSSLGNTHIANQISNNSHFWASTTVPATKNITSVNRVSGTVAVVLATANPFIKLGTCVVNAGVTDATFNTPAGQCFFVTSFTDSTHFSYIQPGAPADASSSGGTNRIATFAEAYLSSGVDDGAQKIQTQSAVAVPIIISNYVEGGQYCKFGTNTLLMGGANTPGCAYPSGSGDWTGQFLNTEFSGLGGILTASLGAIVQNKDASGELYLRAGISAEKNFGITWINRSNARAWGLNCDQSGTLGGGGFCEWTSQGYGQTRLKFFGKDNGTGDTYLNAEGASGRIVFNANQTGTNAGQGGVLFCTGGAGATCPWSVSNAGIATMAAFKSVTANPAAAGTVRLAKTDSLTVRNNANNADITLLSIDGSDNLVLPTVASLTSTGTVIAGALSMGGDSISVTPREAWGSFLPGALTSTWTAAQFTPKKGIIIVQIEVAAKTAPVTCSPNAVIRLTDGSTNLDTTLSAATVTNNIAGGQVYAANSVLQVKVSTAAAGCGTSPADVNVTIQYKMAA